MHAQLFSAASWSASPCAAAEIEYDCEGVEISRYVAAVSTAKAPAKANYGKNGCRRTPQADNIATMAAPQLVLRASTMLDAARCPPPCLCCLFLSFFLTKRNRHRTDEKQASKSEKQAGSRAAGAKSQHAG